MDLTRILRPCCVRVICEHGDPDGDVYAVTDVTGRRARITSLAADLGSMPPGVGGRVLLRSALPDALYVVPVHVVGQSIGTEVKLHIEQTGELERVQRRHNFRVGIKVPVELVEVPYSTQGPLNLVTEDVSAGGIRVLTPRELEQGQVVRVELHLGDAPDIVRCRTRIMRCLLAGPNEFEAGGAFLKLRTVDEDRIIRTLTQALRHQIEE